MHFMACCALEAKKLSVLFSCKAGSAAGCIEYRIMELEKELREEPMHILIVEDDCALRDLIQLNMEIAGYTTTTAERCARAKQVLSAQQHDLAIVDIMLPDGRGDTLLPLLQKSGIPVIMLTAVDDLHTKVTSLRSGADDYMTKPFESIELIARVEALLRRVQGKAAEKMSIGTIQVDRDRREVTKSGQVVGLTPKEYELLVDLLENRNRVRTREQLLQSVWGYDYAGGTRTVDIHIGNLRRKLALSSLETVFKTGYVLKDENS